MLLWYVQSGVTLSTAPIGMQFRSSAWDGEQETCTFGTVTQMWDRCHQNRGDTNLAQVTQVVAFCQSNLTARMEALTSSVYHAGGPDQLWDLRDSDVTVDWLGDI